MVDFLFVIIELVSLSLTVETLKQEAVEVGVFRRGVGHLVRTFQTERGRHSPTTVGVRKLE